MADHCSVMDARQQSKSGILYELSLSVLNTWKNALPQRSLTTCLRIPLEILYQRIKYAPRSSWVELLKANNLSRVEIHPFGLPRGSRLPSLSSDKSAVPTSIQSKRYSTSSSTPREQSPKISSWNIYLHPRRPPELGQSPQTWY